MKVVICYLLFGITAFIAIKSFAQTDYCQSFPSFTKKNSQTQAKWKTFCDGRKRQAELVETTKKGTAELGAAANQADDALGKAQAAYDEAVAARTQAREDASGIIGRGLIGDSYFNTLSPAGTKANAEVKKANANLTAKRKALDQALTNQTKNQQALDSAQAYLNNNLFPGNLTEAERNQMQGFKIDQLTATVDGLGVQIVAGQVITDAAEIERKLEELQSKFDKTDEGIYLADKFNQFANSDLACTIQKRCSTSPQDKERIPAGEVNELFPELSVKRELKKDANYIRTKGNRTNNAR